MTTAPPTLLDAAAAAAGAQQYPAPALYMVATPIGNLADLSLRAVHVLALVDALACEDTRVSGRLLRHLGLSKPLLALHRHNEHAGAAQVLERLARGERVAYTTDAGTPALSDPGAALVCAAQGAGVRVIPIPGASSALTALSVAGDTSAGGFEFVGFLATRSGERSVQLQRVAAASSTQVLFEAPHRIASLVRALAGACPARHVTLCRELTKQFETVLTLPAKELPGWLAADASRGRGEFVLVLHAQAMAPPCGALDAHAERMLATLLRELPLKQAVSLASALSDAPRNAIYQRALALRDATAHDLGEPTP